MSMIQLQQGAAYSDSHHRDVSEATFEAVPWRL
jgi:hypothetical protein